MTSKGWIRRFASAFVLLCLAMLAVNRYLNAFGVFGDARDRPQAFYATGAGAERAAKYLLSLNYVPANFDELVVGTSITGNWNTGRLRPAAYNLSLDGGNITEEAILVRNSLARKKMRRVILCLYPYLVGSHGRQTEYLSPRDYWGAWGSLQLLREYKARLIALVSRSRRAGDEYGAQDFSELRKLTDGGTAARRLLEGKKVVIDEEAMQEYRALVAELRASGAQLVAVIPPHPYGVWNTAEYREFDRRSRFLLRPGETIVDFNGPEYDSFRRDRGNFYDGVHLTQEAAAFLVAEMNRRLGGATAEPTGSSRPASTPSKAFE